MRSTNLRWLARLLCSIGAGQFAGTEADVAELADAIDLGSIARKGVEVRVLSSALEISVRARGQAGRRLLCKQEIVGSNPTGST